MIAMISAMIVTDCDGCKLVTLGLGCRVRLLGPHQIELCLGFDWHRCNIKFHNADQHTTRRRFSKFTSF